MLEYAKELHATDLTDDPKLPPFRLVHQPVLQLLGSANIAPCAAVQGNQASRIGLHLLDLVKPQDVLPHVRRALRNRRDLWPQQLLVDVV